VKGFRIALLLGVLLPCLADEAEPQWAALNRVARQAVNDKDYAKLRVTLEQLRPLTPGNVRVLYNLAASDAMLGQTRKALAELADLAASGVFYDLSADDDFASLRRAPEYAKVVRQMNSNRQPVEHSALVRQLERPDMLPEDITFDRSTGNFLVSSVSGSEVLRVGGNTLAKTPWSVLAIRIDPARRLLWAASAWLPHCTSCRAEDKDKTALVSFNLDTGARTGEFPSPVPGMFGDMTIAGNGDIFVSEGRHGAVFRFSNGRYERLDTPGEFPSPQTPTLSRDERTLYVPDYVRGLAAIDLKTRQVRWLQPGPGIVLSGIDGLYVYGDSFIAVQNGTTPARIIRFTRDLQRQQILEANYPELGEPTHGVLVGDTFYFLANTGWNEFGEDGRKKPGSAPVVSSIRKIELKSLPLP
jgi:hypothetical protein